MFKKLKNGKTNIKYITSLKEVLNLILVLFLLLIPIVLIVLILLSTLKIDIKNIKLTNLSRINKSYKINIKLKLFNHLQWIAFTLNYERIKRINRKIHLDQIDIKKLERDFKLSDIKEIAKIKLKITNMNLEIKLGFEDIFFTTYGVAIIASIISIILPHISKAEDIDSVKYNVKPIYNKGNTSYIELDTKFEIAIFSLVKSLTGMYKNRKDIKYESNMVKKQSFNNNICNRYSSQNLS